MADFPLLAEAVLLELIKGLWRNDKQRTETAYLILNAKKYAICIDAFLHLDNCFKNHICINPVSNDFVFSSHNEPHGMVYTESYKVLKQYSESHAGQWNIFLQVLVNSACALSKENIGDHKTHKKLLAGKTKQIKDAAEKLARLMREADDLSDWGYCRPNDQDIFELILQTAKSMRETGSKDEVNTAVSFEVMTKSEIEKIHLWADSRRMPSTINLIDQIALTADSKEIEFSHETLYMESDNHKFNICLNYFFDEIKRQSRVGAINPAIIETNVEHWINIFTIVLKSTLTRENFVTNLPLTI